MPIAGNKNFVFHESMYSALPTNEMFRGTVKVKNAESRNEMWFGHRIAGPAGRQAFIATELDIPEFGNDGSTNLAHPSLQGARSWAIAHTSEE